MVLARPEDTTAVELRRCPACPLRKKRMCTGIPAMARAADQMVILSWRKLRDTVRDSSWWRGLPARFLSFLLRRDYRRAAAREPVFDAAVTRALETLEALERDRCPSIDRTADAFACLLQAAAESEEDPVRRRVLGQLLYHVGRWIYLVDAVDDLEEDAREGNYNPVALRFPDASNREETLRVSLSGSLSLCRGAFELLPGTAWSEIVANILYLGLPMVENAVFSGQWKEMKKKTFRRIEHE